MIEQPEQAMSEYVTAVVAGQRFGFPILRVQDVFAPERVTRVPLAPQDIAGVLNMRGRIVTLIDMRRRLGLSGGDGLPTPMAIGIESNGESFGLLVDQVGEVLKLDDHARESNPVNLDPRLAEASCGIHRLDNELLVVVDIDRVLAFCGKARAA